MAVVNYAMSVKGRYMMKDPKNEYEELKEKKKLQKNTAKFWGIIITVIVLIVIIWAIASHL